VPALHLVVNRLLQRFEGALHDISGLLDGLAHRIICGLGRRLGAVKEGPGVGPGAALVAAHRLRFVAMQQAAVLGGESAA